MTYALVVDGDDHVLHTLADNIEKRGIRTSIARSVEQARAEMDRRRPDVMLIGSVVDQPGVVDQLTNMTDDNRPRIILMNHTSGTDAMLGRLPTNGQNHHAMPGLDQNHLSRLLDEVEKTCRGQSPDDAPPLIRVGSMVGRSPAMQRIWRTVHKVAPTDATVLIVGESGTGKELVAEAIHQHSPRKERPFVVLNCGAIPDNLIDSELFGHEKGAFTGAARSRSGVFERADGGTLFLDEITEMPIDLQTRLLRILETGRLRRVGGEREIDVDCRVVAATNRSATEAVEQGHLREDLFYRLSVFPIRIPPLRKRHEDIEVLADYFLKELNDQFHQTKQFDQDVLDVLKAFHWPGNVRQLKNAVHRAFIMADHDLITAAMVPRHNTSKIRPQGGPAVTINIGTSIAQAEHQLISATLEHYHGNKKKTAQVLGVSLRTLYNRLNEYESAAAGRQM